MPDYLLLNMNANSNRRDFLKALGLSGAALAAGGTLAPQGTTGAQAEAALASPSGRRARAKYMGDFAAPKLEKVRWGMIGVGNRGSGHATQLAQIEGSEIVAISDLYGDWAKRSATAIEQLGKPSPTLYYGSPDKYHEMLARPDIDAVIIATPWEEHAPMVIAAMKAGKHAFVEVPLAFTLKDLWEVVETSERTSKHCMMMENCNYGREELLFLNMCRQGVLGELLHGESAYIHELRFQMKDVERGTSGARRCGRQGDHGLRRVLSQHLLVHKQRETAPRALPTEFPLQGNRRPADSM